MDKGQYSAVASGSPEPGNGPRPVGGPSPRAPRWNAPMRKKGFPGRTQMN